WQRGPHLHRHGEIHRLGDWRDAARELHLHDRHREGQRCAYLHRPGPEDAGHAYAQGHRHQDVLAHRQPDLDGCIATRRRPGGASVPGVDFSTTTATPRPLPIAKFAPGCVEPRKRLTSYGAAASLNAGRKSADASTLTRLGSLLASA